MKPELIIDPGHGGKDPGGGSSIFWDPNGFYEKDMVLNISLYQYERFKQLGVPVALTRSTDIYLSPEERTDIIKASRAKYCFSNHINATGNPAVMGAETIHSLFNNGQLAHKLLEGIVAEGVPRRRVFYRESEKNPGTDYYFMHRLTGSVSTTIIEYEFATSPHGAQRVQKNWKRYAEAVVKVFCTHIDHPYEELEKEEKLPQTKQTTRVTFEGKELSAWITDQNRSVAEIRELAELIGLRVHWNAQTQTVELYKK